MLKQGKSRHSQISQWLKDQIVAGAYKINEKLPSENELAEKFGVSRVTVRRALQTLEGEEVIYRCQGLGSFVSDPRTRHSLVRLTDFTEDMVRFGLKAESEVISFKPVIVPDPVAERLMCKSGSKVSRIDRLRLGDGDPVAFDVTWMPLFYSQLLDDYDLKEKTIYKILEEEYQIPIVRGCYQIQAENADKYIAAHLQIDMGSAVLLINRLSYTVKEKPVYYQNRYYRSDKVFYELLMERKNVESDSAGDLPLRELNTIFKKVDV